MKERCWPMGYYSFCFLLLILVKVTVPLFHGPFSIRGILNCWWRNILFACGEKYLLAVEETFIYWKRNLSLQLQAEKSFTDRGGIFHC